MGWLYGALHDDTNMSCDLLLFFCIGVPFFICQILYDLTESNGSNSLIPLVLSVVFVPELNLISN